MAMTSPNVVEEVVVVQEECGDEYILPEYTMSTPSTNSTHQSDEAPYPKIPARPAKRYWISSRADGPYHKHPRNSLCTHHVVS